MPTKPTLNITDLASHLKSSKNIDTNSNKTHSYLTYINYSLLKPYISITPPIASTNTELEQVVKHYDFDRKLKLLLWDGLERIEVSCRSVLCLVMKNETQNEQWFCDSKMFDSHDNPADVFITYFKKQHSNIKSFLRKNGISTISEWNNLSKIFCDIAFNKHIANTYTDLSSHSLYNHNIDTLIKSNSSALDIDLQNFLSSGFTLSKVRLLIFLLSKFDIPFYCIMNKLDFGKTNTIISNLKPAIRTKIADQYSQSIKEVDFIKHIEHFRTIRNKIAHHEPLCTSGLSKIHNFSYYTKYDTSSIKGYCELILFYLDLIAPRNTLKHKIDNLIEQYKHKYNISFSAWGF